MKTFLAAGDVLINPSLLAYAFVETDSDGVQVRLGFSGQAGAPQKEVRLVGLEARSVLRWLRTNSEFLDSGPPAHPRDRHSFAAASKNLMDGPAACRGTAQRVASGV
jgi:hypothetical protein